MCLTFFYLNKSDSEKNLKFVQVFNREEFLERNTLSLDYFEDKNNIVGGRDCKSKGTWLGINKENGLISFLTNRTSLKYFVLAALGINQDKNKKSRGFLITDFLEEKKQNLVDQKEMYNGYNLVQGDLKKLEFSYFSNFNQNQNDFIKLNEGFHTMCNYVPLNEKLEKQIYGEQQFTKIVNKYQTEKQLSIQNLFQELQNLSQHKQKFQPNYQKLQLENEASIFFKPYKFLFKKYRATKSTTIVVMDKNNKVFIQEITYNYDQKESSQIKEMEIQL